MHPRSQVALGFAVLLASSPALAQSPEPEAPHIHLEGAELTGTPGALGDPFRVVMTLPGVSGVASGVGQPVFRGMEPATTGFFLDGVRVPLAYHLLVGPSVVHPDFIGSIDLYRSAPVEHGGLMGAVVDARPPPPSERARGTATLDELSLGLFSEVPLPESGTRVSVAGRLGYSPLLFAAISNARAPAPGQPASQLVLDVYDYQARVEQRVGPGTLRLLAFGASDAVGLKSADGLSGVPFQASHRVDLRYRQPLGVGEAEAGATWGWDRLGAEGAGGPSAKVSLAVTERTAAARASWTARVASVLALVVGADVEHRDSDFRQVATLRPGPVDAPDRPTLTTGVHNPVAIATVASAYAQATWTQQGWVFLPVLRVVDFHLVPGMDQLAVEPRLTARKALGPVTLSAVAGMFHQAPTSFVTLPGTEAAGLGYGMQEGAQLGLEALWKPAGWELSANAYFNPLLRTVELSLADTDFLKSAPEVLRLRESWGQAYGVELFARRDFGAGLFGWVSYSLQQSRRRERFVRHDAAGEVLGEDVAYVPYAQNQVHVLNAVATLPLPGGFTLGAGVHFNSGVPEAGGLTSVTAREGTGADGHPRWVEQDLDKVDRLPGFFRVDARVAKAWALRDFSLEASLEVLNVTLARETLRYGYDVRAASNEDLLAGRVTLVKSASGYVPVPVTVPLLSVKASY